MIRFVVGGVDEAGSALGVVDRAQVLRVADASVLDEATSSAGGALGSGTYYSRVSAVLDSSDPKNPSGETLASDEPDWTDHLALR
jgi:hypothetical protein